jgi:glucuronate isomerase
MSIHVINVDDNDSTYILAQLAITKCDDVIQNHTGILTVMTKKLLMFVEAGDEENDHMMKQTEFLIQLAQASIRLSQIEKMMFKALQQQKKSPLLFKKFKEMMSSAMDVYEKGVQDGIICEEKYLDFCRRSVPHFAIFKQLCEEDD